MRNEFLNLALLFLAIAKTLALTGIGLGFVIAVVCEWRGFRVVAIGIEKVSRRAVSPTNTSALSNGNKLAANVWKVAA